MQFVSGSLTDAEEEDRRFHLSTNVTEHSAKLHNNWSTAKCPPGTAFVGAYNSGGTKNLSDLTRLRCMNFDIRNPHGGRLGLTSEDTNVDFSFSGTGTEVNAACPSGMWLAGIRKGKNDNPNEAEYICRRIFSDGTLDGQDLADSDPTGSLQVVPSPPNPAGTLTPTGFSDGSNRWGACGGGQAGYAFKVSDKGSNLYDIRNIRCTPRAQLTGDLLGKYTELRKRPDPDQRVVCCDSDSTPPAKRVAHKQSCAALGLNHDMTAGNCRTLGFGAYCQSKDPETGDPMLVSDETCQKWCNMYPDFCDDDEGAKVAWCDEHPDSPWCDCLKASTRPSHQVMLGYWDALRTAPHACWWTPCKESSTRVLTTKEIREGRYKCPDIVSQNLYIDGDGNIVDVDFNIIQRPGSGVDLPPGWAREIDKMTCEELESVFGYPTPRASCNTRPPPDNGNGGKPDNGNGGNGDNGNGDNGGPTLPPPDDEGPEMWIIVVALCIAVVTVSLYVASGPEKDETLEIFTASKRSAED